MTRVGELGRALVLRGDALRLPLPDESVDLIVTSPPYFALRSYTDSGGHYAGQIGSEATPQEFLEALWAATAEMVRVLKPSGSIFVNLGDKYAGSRMDGSSDNGTGATGLAGTPSIRDRTAAHGRTRSTTTIPAKSLMLLPERYRIGCVDRLDLIARAVIVWAKPNGLPESVTDRVRRSHEDWVHLVKQPRYYTAIDEIREAHAGEFLSSGVRNPRYGRPSGLLPWELRGDTIPSGARSGLPPQSMGRPGPKSGDNPLGKLPGSVWTIPTEPLTVPAHLGVDHFAAFPTAWPRRLILGFSPPGICVECGEGRRPVTMPTGATGRRPGGQNRHNGRTYLGLSDAALVIRAITGYVCACTPYTDHEGDPVERSDDRATGLPPRTTRGQLGAAPTTGAWREYHFDHWTPARVTPAVILDPFGGTGTTALVARALGRVGITVDRSHDYSRLAAWRTSDRRELAKALQVPKPERPDDAQGVLFA